MSADLIEIDCGEVFSIAQSMEIYTQLSVAFEEQQTVSVDISKVEKIDIAGLQLLYSFQHDAIAKNLVIVWTEPSEVFKNAVDIVGMPTFYVTQ